MTFPANPPLFKSRQIDLIFFRKNGFVVLRQSHFHYSIVFACAEKDSYGRIFIGKFFYAVVIINIHLHLSEILMCDFACFQFEFNWERSAFSIGYWYLFENIHHIALPFLFFTALSAAERENPRETSFETSFVSSHSPIFERAFSAAAHSFSNG